MLTLAQVTTKPDSTTAIVKQKHSETQTLLNQNATSNTTKATTVILNESRKQKSQINTASKLAPTNAQTKMPQDLKKKVPSNTKGKRHSGTTSDDDSDEELPSFSPIASLPSYLQQIVKIYCVLHILKQQMEDSVQHCQEQWETILFSCPSYADVVGGEEAIIELCKDIKPELGLKLQEMNKLMNEMIHVENDCLNLVEDVEESLAIVIKKTNWYKSNPSEFKRFLKKYCTKMQSKLKKERKGKSTETTILSHASSILKLDTSPKKKKTENIDSETKEDRVSKVLQEGAFSLDHRSSRMLNIFNLLLELKQDENNKILFNKHAVLKGNAATRNQAQNPNVHPIGKEKKPADELDQLLSKIQHLQQEHDVVMKKIHLLKKPGVEAFIDKQAIPVTSCGVDAKQQYLFDNISNSEMAIVEE